MLLVLHDKIARMLALSTRAVRDAKVDLNDANVNQKCMFRNVGETYIVLLTVDLDVRIVRNSECGGTGRTVAWPPPISVDIRC